jgi:hypothetical protein
MPCRRGARVQRTGPPPPHLHLIAVQLVYGLAAVALLPQAAVQPGHGVSGVVEKAGGAALGQRSLLLLRMWGHAGVGGWVWVYKRMCVCVCVRACV